MTSYEVERLACLDKHWRPRIPTQRHMPCSVSLQRDRPSAGIVISASLSNPQNLRDDRSSPGEY